MAFNQVKYQIKVLQDLDLITVTDDKIILHPLLDKDVIRLSKELIDKLLTYNIPMLITVYAYLYEHRDPEPVSATDLYKAFGYSAGASKQKLFRSIVETLYMDRLISLRFVREIPWTVLSTPRKFIYDEDSITQVDLF